MKSDLKISYPGSQKVYLNGNIHPSVKVGMRMVTQLPTVSIKDGERIETSNPSVYIYDTSGPYGDNDTVIDLKKGLPHLRKAWIDERNTLDANNVSQMYYAKKGIITPEMDTAMHSHCFRFGFSFSISAPSTAVNTGPTDETMPVKEVVVYLSP